MRCSECNGGCFKPACLPQFQEDRLRMYSDGRGGRYSYCLGRDMPYSRSELKALERAGNFVFVSPKENVSPQQTAAMEYHKAIQAGATHEQAEKAAPWPKPPPRRLKDYVGPWAEERHAQGKPLDAVTDSEMTPELAEAGFKQVS